MTVIKIHFIKKENGEDISLAFYPDHFYDFDFDISKFVDSGLTKHQFFFVLQNRLPNST